MALHLAVDEVRLVVEFLKSQPDFKALGAGVSPELPATLTLPYVRVTRTGGQSSYPYWIDQPRLYVECYAATYALAETLKRTTRAALLTGMAGNYGLGIVTDVTEVAGPAYVPDPVRTPATPRFVFSIALTTHPST